jgi:S-DNA-T family DNA segregation ATPase FtsK/SpoIIIE
VLDDDSLHEVLGIVLSALAIALAITLFSNSEGVIPHAVSALLRSGFGLGAYAIPFVVLLWAATFFMTGLRVNEVRVGVGLGLVLLAFTSVLAIGNELYAVLTKLVA